MKRVVIHQPDFAPYLGFFHRLLAADELILLDDVQFLRRGWHHRDKIKTPDGEQWLTLSVKKGDFHQTIEQVLLSPDTDWVERHLNLLREHYRRAPAFDAVFPRLEQVYRAGFERMIDLNIAFLELFYELSGLRVVSRRSSSLGVCESSTARLVALLRSVGATHYLSGLGARAYLDESLFAAAGIVVEWQAFEHPVYPQLHGPFIPFLSCFDVALNCGTGAKEVVRSCSRR